MLGTNRFTPQPSVLFDSGSAEGRHGKRFFRRSRRLTGSARFPAPELAAAAAVIAYVEKDPAFRAARAVSAGTGKRRVDAVHRSGDTQQSGADEDAVGRAARGSLFAENHRPHGERWRWAAFVGAADVTAHRSGRHQPSGSIPCPGSSQIPQTLRTVTRDALRGSARHAASIVADGAQPRRAARSRRHPAGVRGGRQCWPNCWTARKPPAEIAEAFVRPETVAGGDLGAKLDFAANLPTSCHC